MKLLVADDSSLYRGMLQTLLQTWGYEVVLAHDGNEARRILDSDDAPRLAILDCVMPGPSGPELCEMVRRGKRDYIYMILLSANGEQSDVMRGFELGADDYLAKPFKEFELRARLKVGERIIRVHEELVEAREALKFEAQHDSMVGLWNRKAILDLLHEELSRAQRSHSPISIFLADLDFFKRVNDTYGHSVGDDVLRRAAERMTHALREYDHVGRYGGEEFLVVLPDCTADAAREAAERVRRNICDEPILIEPEIHITVSIGVCEWRPGQDISGLLYQTDAALYRAKHRDRNRVELGDRDPGNMCATA